jgi:16S rRNA (adenine1518-N6/adenine1519-N6)-dimethyltransferase
MKAKKSLGQHFLRSSKALSDILDASDPNAHDLILEIGPGEGVLTEKLLVFAAKVVAVEKDDGLYELLKEKFAEEIRKGKLDLIHGDILEFNPQSLEFYEGFSYKIVANIPYNITGAIIRKFLSADFQPEIMVLLVQKEVAERIVTKDGKESILSIAVKAYGKPQYVSTVKAGSFAPAPKVDSAIIAIEGISKEFFKGFPEKFFFELIHAGFGSKRKKVSSNLAKIYGKERVERNFQELSLDENARAEDLNIETWGKIARKCQI